MPDQQESNGLQQALLRIERAWAAGDKELDLSYLKLAVIPAEVGQLTRLKKLNLGFNELTAVPDFIGQFSQLETLALPYNQIESIPGVFGQLTRLKELHLYGNRLTLIPDWLADLAELECLDLAINEIASIPGSIGQLTQLRTLVLAFNHLTAIPSAMFQLSQLENLNLNGNRLTVIPASVAHLVNLRVLDLSDNRLNAVPDSLARLTRLQELYLHGNDNLAIPKEILGRTWDEVADGAKPKPPRQIFAYLAEAAESRPLNEAKLILVGQGAVGKTSLVKTLITRKFNKKEKNTEGIKIRDWVLSLNRKEKVTVHVWDFGGQEMMHATHQFFLTQRSLYLLVLNRRQGGVDREADYWFRMIRAFGGKDAPVIVVLNKQKREPFDVNREGWLEKYRGNIAGFVATDCEDVKTITLLKRKIVEQLQAMESLKARFPRRWFAVKNALTQMPEERISFEDYRRLCQEKGESDPTGQMSLAGFLHDLGIALNYRQDPRLHFNYVLKPEWVTQGIYALLHAFVAKKGVFTHAEAASELAKKRYSPEDTEFILGLMEQFELSFSLGDRQNRVLIPELLDEQQPRDAAGFKPEECLNFGYQYPVLPEGLLPRFIARTHHLSSAETRWKSGVILEDLSSGCRALVRADSPEAEVCVRIGGPAEGRRELLGIIRHNFEAIHADYEFKPEALVYAPQAPQEALPVKRLEAMAKTKATVPVLLPDDTVIDQDIVALMAPLETLPPLKLFLSYSHVDESFLNELRKDLKVMERNGKILPWYDRALPTGDQWEPSILHELSSADIVICQISRNYLASDNCMAELKKAIERSHGGEALLAAYVLTPCQWKEIQDLPKLQLLPKDAKPLSEWPDPNAYWSAVADGIREAVKSLQAKRKSLPSAGWARSVAGSR